MRKLNRLPILPITLLLSISLFLTTKSIIFAAAANQPFLPHRTLLLSSSSSAFKRRSSPKETPSQEYERDLIPYEDSIQPPGQNEEPTLEEIRASLGPIGRTIAGGVEVGVITAGSFLSGGILGYCIGGVWNVPVLFRSTMERGGAGNEIKKRIMVFHSKAAKQAGTWANLSAAFSGFHALSRVLRGGKEDKWNGVLGSAATGAYLSRKGGPQAMIQGGATYASITYLLDMTLGSGSSDRRNNVQHPIMDQEFEYTEEE